VGSEKWMANFPYGLFQEMLRYLGGVINVDIQATEQSYTDFFNVGTVSSPATLVVPSSGSALTTRAYHIAIDSTAGTILLKYGGCGSVIGAVFCSKYNADGQSRLNIHGSVGDPIILVWDDLSTGATIFVSVTYKEE